MEHTTETKFSDYLIERRFKKLERALKIATLRKGHIQGDESWPLPMSPSISSINADTFDSSINVPSLPESKIGSVVVSSSKNFRNMVSSKKDINNHSNICTSSVKKFNNMDNSEKDYFLMPPPNFDPVSHSCKKLISTSACITVRVFTQWKVALNEQGQLIIQGQIDCGKIARSKPILRRLTSRELQSVFKHIYQLKGDIVDEGNELPDYVRGKFCNGFPYDWENVCQVWRTFMQEGSKLTFRWPTPLADSDDDLRSEVTDITYTEGIHVSQIDSVLETNKSDQYFKSSTRGMSNSVTHMSNVNENNQQNSDKEHQKQLTNVVANCSYNDNKTNKLKDKLNVMINNLTDRNFPQEFVTKILEIFDCLSYVVSHGSIKDNESNMEISTSVQDKSIVKEHKNNIRNESFSLYDVDCNKSKCKSTVYQNQNYPENTEHVIVNNKFTCNDSSSNVKIPIKMNSREDSHTSDSESEIYAGVPKIPAQQILRQRETLVKSYRRKSRIKLPQQKCNIVEKEHTSNIPLINSKNINCSAYDSSVSIIEDKVVFSNNKGIINSNVEDSISKNVNPNETLKRQQEVSSVFLKEINARGMQEHSNRINLTSVCKPLENLSDSININESNAKKITEMSENKNEIIETSIQNQSFEKQSYNENDEHHQEVSNKQLNELSSCQFKDVTNIISKPVVISSEPVNLSSIYTEVKQTKDTNGNIKKAEKEAYLVKEKSLKSPNVFRDIDSVLLLHNSKQKLLQENRICDEKSNNDDTKVNLLSGWTPKVIYDPASCLIFEGKLVNDAGHVVDRKFQTDVVLRRVSSKLVETVSHKFYQLVGDLNDSNHAIPKSLMNQCRYGCPSNIKQFCKAWKSLQNSENNSASFNRSIDDINIRISSKGRRVIPALHYWAGERFSIKNDNPVYTPGSPQDTLQSINESPNKRIKETKKGGNSKQKRNLDELKKSSVNSANKSINNGSIEYPRKIKRIAVERSDSSDSSDNKKFPTRKRRKVDSNLQNTEVNGENLHKHHLEDGETKLISNSTKLKTRSGAKLSAQQINEKQMSSDRYIPSTGNYEEECLYYKNFRPIDDTLSEDQESHV